MERSVRKGHATFRIREQVVSLDFLYLNAVKRSDRGGIENVIWFDLCVHAGPVGVDDSSWQRGQFERSIAVSRLAQDVRYQKRELLRRKVLCVYG